MKNSILIASLFAVALAACGKKEEAAPVEPVAPAVMEQAPAMVEPAMPAATEPAAAAAPAPAAAAGTITTEPAPAAAPMVEEKK